MYGASINVLKIMSNFLSLCNTRASVRDYLPTLPTAESIARIKEAVRLAPSACNKQPWRFFYVTNPEILARICQTYPRPWLATAPALFVAVKNVAENWVRPADNHAPWATLIWRCSGAFVLGCRRRGIRHLLDLQFRHRSLCSSLGII